MALGSIKWLNLTFLKLGFIQGKSFKVLFINGTIKLGYHSRLEPLCDG